MCGVALGVVGNKEICIFFIFINLYVWNNKWYGIENNYFWGISDELSKERLLKYYS